MDENLGLSDTAPGLGRPGQIQLHGVPGELACPSCCCRGHWNRYYMQLRSHQFIGYRFLHLPGTGL